MKITGVTQQHLTHDLDGAYEPTWIPGYAQGSHEVELFILETDTDLRGITASPSFAGGIDYETPLEFFLVGEDPHAIGRIRRKLASIDLLGPRPWHIEAACWDLIGKDAGKPLSELLGGEPRPINAYASTGERQGIDERLDYVDDRVAEGFEAVKLRFGHDPTADIAVAEAVRDAYPDLTLMVDGNMGWSVRVFEDPDPWSFGHALEVARELERIGNVAWLEEPLDRHDYDGLARLRERTDVPIAGGEFNDGLHEFREFIAHGSLDVLQPDAMLASGIKGAVEIAGMARTNNLQFAPHTWTNGIGLAANLHVMAAAEATWCEYPLEPPWTPAARDFLIRDPIVVEDGMVAPPDGPGLGIELAPDVVDAVE